MKYKVLYDRGFTFAKWEDARHFAEMVFKSTGIIAGIIKVKA